MQIPFCFVHLRSCRRPRRRFSTFSRAAPFGRTALGAWLRQLVILHTHSNLDFIHLDVRLNANLRVKIGFLQLCQWFYELPKQE